MRVTFVLPLPSLAGGVRVVAEYAVRLRERGHVVHVVSPDRPPAQPLGRVLRDRLSSLKRGRLAEAVVGKRLPTPPSHFDTLGDLLDRRPQAGPLRDADVPDADVVVATWWETVPWVAALSASKGRKVHFLQHDERVMAWNEAAAKHIGRISWHTPNFARVAVARWIADVGIREFGVDACRVVANAVDTDLFHSPPRELGHPPTVGFMDSDARFKGADVAQAAWEIARRRIPSLALVTFGSSADPKRPLPAEARHAHAPPQHTIPGIYASCDVWIVASRCEGFGLPILEAMACGTPVIGTPTGAAPDLIDGTNGRIVNFDDPAGLADAIVEVVTQDAAAWRAMSDAARSTARRHDWAASTSAFEEFLHDAVAHVTRTGEGATAGPR